MTFGKNRVQHYDYYWSFYRFENIDCYFNEYGRHLAQYTADYAIRKLNETEDFFDYNLEKRLVFIINKSNNEYRESNVGLVTGDEDSYNTGGFSRIIKNKVLLYYEGDHVAYQKQIGASITEVIVNEMLYDADMRDRISSSSVITIPDWYIKGLANYVSFGWDVETENRVKDGIMTGYYKNINHLEYDDAVYAGQSFWRFIGKEYGDALIPNIIYLTKVYKNIEDGLLYVIGKNVKELMKEWKEFYRNEFADDGAQPGYDENVIARSKKEQIFQQVKISPDARYIAFVTNTWGRKKIRIYDQTTGKQKVIFRKEPKYEHITDDTYPVIAWHPGGKILTYINEENAGMVIYFYRTEEKKTEKRNLLYFDKILDFSYSPEGSRLIFSGVKDGITDLYLHTISSGTNEQITRDIADDLHPSFLEGGEDMIIFSSNRLSDTLTNTADPLEKVGNTFSLFTYDLSQRNNVLTRLT
jgi:Tol biopolymer transport system component